MKRGLFLILGLLGIMAVKAAVVSGCVKGADKPLGEVIVTDGFSFVVTDRSGNYSINLHDRAEFVYLLTPKGFVADFSSGVPQFYQKIEPQKRKYDFDLLRMEGDPERSVMITLADPQLDTSHDVQRMKEESLPDILGTLRHYDGVQQAGIVLGDITWDVYVHNRTFKDFARQTGIPFYPVIGNHDFDKYLEPTEGADYAHVYKEHFGPLYYAFQLGEVYYVVLNNMKYMGHKKYRTTLLIDDQMNWLTKLLNCVLQQDKQVVVAMHAPMKPSDEYPMIEGGEELRKMLVNKFHASIISGHYHRNSNKDLGAGIIEHNVGALCGTWWNGDTGSDGTPCGYQVWEWNGSRKSVYFKTTGKERDFQFKTYGKGMVMDRPDALVVKVWNWDKDWRIRWYENGCLKGDMEQFYSYDPDYLAHLNGRRAVADYEPVRTNHFFSANPSEKASEILIEVTDSFGNVYVKTVFND